MDISMISYYRYKGRKGERYFKITDLPDGTRRCIQVCLAVDIEKRGRGNMIGINFIKWISIISNYAWDSASRAYHECSKQEYDQAFKRAIMLLKSK